MKYLRLPIESLLIPIFSLFVIVGAVLAASTSRLNADWQEFYFMGYIGLITLFGVYSLKSQSKVLLYDHWRENFLFLIVTGVFLIVRFKFISTIPLWLDEDMQLRLALSEPSAIAGAKQNQPPNDMALVKLASYLAPNFEVTARLFAVVFSACAAGLMSVISYRNLKSVPLAIAITVIFGFNSIIVQYGAEGRPISHGIFSLLLFALTLQRLIENRERLFLNYLELVAVTLFYLSSLGLQPPFVIASLSAGVVLLSIRRKENLKVIAAIILGLALYLPIQEYVVSFSGSQLLHIDFRERISRAIAAFHSLKRLDDYYYSLSYFTHYVWSTSFGASILGLVLIAFYPMRKVADSLVLFGLSPSIFIAGLPIAFAALIDWHLHDYYLISAWPLLILSFIMIVRFLLDYIKKSWIQHSLTSIVAFGVLYFAWPINFEHKQETNHGSREDLRSFYQKVLADPRPSKIIANVCPENNAEDFCPKFLIGSSFYLPQDEKIVIPKDDGVLAWIDAMANGTESVFTFFLIFQYNWSPKIYDKVEFKECPVPYGKWQLVTAYSFENNEGLMSAEKCLSEVINFVESSGRYSIRGIEVLIPILIRLNKTAEAKSRFEKYKQLLALRSHADHYRKLKILIDKLPQSK